MQRRDLFKLGAALVFPAAPFLSACSQSKTETQFFSALRKKGNDHIAGFNSAGELSFMTPVDERCHGGAFNSVNKHTAWPARSPGNCLYILNRAGELDSKIDAEQGHHFYGHAQFSHDGRWLLTTENRFSDGEGRIVVRDVENGYVIKRSFSSGGIGPHEFRFMSDGRHLAIANGGILTHPDSSHKLNIESMRPSLAIVDFETGSIVRNLELPHSKLSIRHLAINNIDQVVLLTQYQGILDKPLPLIYKWQPGETSLSSLANPVDEQLIDQDWLGYQQYMASGALTDTGILAATTPRGNRIGFWDINKNTFLSHAVMKDVAGIALANDGQSFVASSGRGRLWQFSSHNGLPITPKPVRVSSIGWDNHMLAV